MEFNDWKYYNHAMIPTTAPHEIPDISSIKDGSIWKENKHALFARWTTDFDCDYETDWWYIVRWSPFDFDCLDSSSRKHIRQALKKCKVNIINPKEEIEHIYRVYEEAYTRYKKFDNKHDYNVFKKQVENNVKDGVEYWGAYNNENRLIGWISVKNYNTYIQTITAKFSTDYLKLGASAALYYHILTYYLNGYGIKYVCSGEKSINHTTNTQEYKIKTFGYKKVYCKLNIAYNPKIKWIIKMLYPFRKLLKCFDCIMFLHRVNAVLSMEEIVRKQK